VTGSIVSQMSIPALLLYSAYMMIPSSMIPASSLVPIREGPRFEISWLSSCMDSLVWFVECSAAASK